MGMKRNARRNHDELVLLKHPDDADTLLITQRSG